MDIKGGECNWFLLFDIALSHGESIRQQRLRYCGLLTLLRSAGLFGPKTGVYQFLVESLWHFHGKPLRPNGNGDATKGDFPFHDLAVDFDGFLAIMNVICVRCYQTQRCSELLEEKCPALDAIMLSAEDQVRLKESVMYTARRFFKPLINRCLVLKRTVISLNSMKNGWTPYTNQFVIHVMASSARSIVLPLFNLYAVDGRIYRGAFEKMLDDVFPNFTPVQQIGARSIFDYSGFFGIHNLMEYSTLEFPNGRVAALEFDSFAEALLMLGVVAFSDEVHYEHHRPFTAKVWSVFEDYYSKFVGAPMVDDPIIDNKYASIIPTINLLFPSRVPIDKTSSFIIGGWNLTVDDRSEDSLDLGKDYPPRILQLHKLYSTPDGGNGRRTSGSIPATTAGLASKLFEEEFNRQFQAEYDLLIYGMRRCAVYVNEIRVMAFQRGSNRVEVVIPSSMWNISVHTIHVHFVESREDGKLILSPITKALVSLRDGSGSTIFSSKDVIFVAAPLVEVIPASHVRELKDLFGRHSTEAVMTFEEFSSACAELCVDTLVAPWGDCSSFLEMYLERQSIEEPSDAGNVTCKKDTIYFQEFVSAVATLLLYQLDADGYMPNIPYLFGVVLSRLTHNLPPLFETKKFLGTSSTSNQLPNFLQPNNARIDVPYANALRKKASSVDSLSNVKEILKSVGKGRTSMRLLPEFPAEARTVAFVSQYTDDEKGLQEKVRTVSASLRRAFLKKEMVVCQHGLKAE
ncbi:hypothetical protein MOQ_002517 [Trypanosoma cruzi marinkellei]|uniref:Uncharacterized protein n=1 Tax=Trypanosoma cruzi marinkellei TaxID=85056 RepID=K2N291_TRYCR|nr:hypothetical protein MOQ_002517 [Trypanosoma cruzi marinkellei]